MANFKHLSLGLVVVMSLMLVAHEAEAVLNCNQVTSSLVSCVQYLQSGGAMAIAPACCAGIRSLNAAAQSTPDRQTVCGCLKNAASRFPALNIGLAASIPGKCGVNIPYKLDPNTDCAKVH